MTEPEKCRHGVVGPCVACHIEAHPPSAALRGSEVDKDVGIADQHRARLGARIAGNVASGMVADRLATPWEQLPPAQLVADMSSLIAEAIMRRWGL